MQGLGLLGLGGGFSFSERWVHGDALETGDWAETETGGAPHAEVGTTPSQENKETSMSITSIDNVEAVAGE